MQPEKHTQVNTMSACQPLLGKVYKVLFYFVFLSDNVTAVHEVAFLGYL